MNIIAVLGLPQSGKSTVAHLLSTSISRSTVLSIYDVLEWVQPGYKKESRASITAKILEVRKHFLIDALKVRIAFIPNAIETIIIDDIDDPFFTADLKNKLKATTVEVIKTFPVRLPARLNSIAKPDEMCPTDYKIFNHLLISETRDSVRNLIEEMIKNGQLREV